MDDAAGVGALMAGRVVSITAGGKTRSVRVEDDGRATVDEKTFHVVAAPASGELVVTHDTEVDRVFVTVVDDTTWVFHDGNVYELTAEAEGVTTRRQHHGSLSAPMPATVVSVHARPGDAVTRGMILIVLEAMKMELPVRAPADGVVTAVNCRPGDLVQPGTPLIDVQ